MSWLNKFKGKPGKAAVLGCGPAGLFAAWGLERAGYTVSIFSKKRKSHLYGAQYLHAPIPELTLNLDPIRVSYHLNGSVDGYRQKVYGSIPVKVSPEALEMEHDAWDLRATYDLAWDWYQDRIINLELSPEVLGVPVARMLDESEESFPIRPTFLQYDVIVSTVPLPILCYQRDLHQFHASHVWAYGDAPDRGQFAPYRPGPGQVECDGTRDVGWYRASNIYDHVTVEWPHNRKPPLPGVAEVTKPVYTDCNCYRDGTFPVKFVPLGRYGQWLKGVLTHHAFTQAAQL